MPRKQFQADLSQAVQGKHNVPSICDVRVGEDDGQFSFVFSHSTLTAPVSITAGVLTELSDYPKAHDFYVWAADDTPPDVAHLLDASLTDHDKHGKTIDDFISLVAAKLSNPQSPGSDPESEDDMEEEDLEEDDGDDEDFYASVIASQQPTTFSASTTVRAAPANSFHARIRSDLKHAKDAGFKIAYFGPLLDGAKSVVSVSISARKLGISAEAMQAWQIESSDQLILLIEYADGYKTKEELTSYGVGTLGSHLRMRVGACKRYKPTSAQVFDAFTTTDRAKTDDDAPAPADAPPFHDVFISKPLNNLLQDRLIPLLRHRAAGMTWKGAEDFYRETQGISSTITYVDSSHYVPEDSSGYPAVVDADHMSNMRVKEHSFPLLAMQFTLRHFVRCTEFCLVCHRKLDSLVEALTPYVCDNPLCLYQYMALGFGPSIEHQILAQDKVVDLLVSFCYASAILGRLRDFPTGLAFDVPRSFITPVHQRQPGRGGYQETESVTAAAIPKSDVNRIFETRFDATRRELLFDNVGTGTVCPIKGGDWVSIKPLDSEITYQCKVVDSYLFPTIRLGPLTKLDDATLKQTTQVKPSITGGPTTKPKVTDVHGGQWYSATVERYSINFDDLAEPEKRGVICKLLASLPSVKDMKAYLKEQRTPDLTKWTERISPAVLSVLRWIVASNRACILEVDPFKAVSGMQDWMQFRFAMGAPDKEHRFLTAVRDTSVRLSLQYPTMFAWHGSMIQNWHSIIREGLNFNSVINGRAFGDGVYHSPQLATSLGYSGAHYAYSGQGTYMWPNSGLQISSAIALNELVNAPAEFKSASPHYVVQHVDWIQTRYLFVKCSAEAEIPPYESVPTEKHVQDPTRIPVGHTGPIVIPAPIAKVSKRKLSNVVSPGPKATKKSKKPVPLAAKIIPTVIDLTGDEEAEDEEDEAVFEDDGKSDVTDDEDLEIFREPELELAVRQSPSETDFVPGSLDHESLPKLSMPTYANSGTTKRLQQDFQALLKVQNNTASHERGWYVDPEKLDNIYQWIVELHSFHMFKEDDQELPLSVDMKKHGVKSIVLELRFPGSYPMNPPFIRVIRPRFLPFLSGGGGHVTAGGAICHMILASDGWLPSYSIESVLLQIRMAMASVDPKPARLQITGKGLDARNSYGAGEAVDAYKRACKTHGWEIPSDFNQTAAGGQ